MTIAIETIPRNRQEVTLAGAVDALRSDVTVYVFIPGEFDLDPWRVVDGIDEYFDGKTVDIWFASGTHWTVFKGNMSMRFFVSKKDT